MATRFKPLKLENPELFGVSLSGGVGRTDKTNLLDMAEKCLAKGKVKLILELSELTTIGGGGARILAELQEKLVAHQGEAVFVGAGDVVKHFLGQKFDELPLRYFTTVEDAQNSFTNSDQVFQPATPDPISEPEPEPALAPEPEPVAPAPEKPVNSWEKEEAEPETAETEEIGAIGFHDEEEESLLGEDLLSEDEKPVAPQEPEDVFAVQERPRPEPEPDSAPPANDEATLAMNEVLEEFNGSEDDDFSSQAGRRRDHEYTSLSEAIMTLGNWEGYKGLADFSVALRNLLFSHGLAEDSLLLTVQDDLLADADQEWQLPLNGSLVRQLAGSEGPMSMLDVNENDLDDYDSQFLEELTPDILMPVIKDGKVTTLLLLSRGEGDQEYSVAEHFALELLLWVLSQGHHEQEREVDPDAVANALRDGGARKGQSPVRDAILVQADEWAPPRSEDETTAEVLLKLALDLPDAEDKPHFWRLFARDVWPAFPIRTLGFLGPGLHRAQVIAGDSDKWSGLNLGEEKLKHFFKSMERPVEVACLPNFFRDVKIALGAADAEWIIGLKHDGSFLGSVFVGVEESFISDNPPELMREIFSETARLLHRFDGSNDIADVNLQIVKILLAQREKRCYGTDDMTEMMVDLVHRLARAMGFPPDQERHLIYGCLLRDIGLVDKDDALMGSPENMDPTQWPKYRNHPLEGGGLVVGLDLPRTIVDVIECHHERFNGEGFPRGLAGRKIPLAARVVTVVENYVSMVTGARGMSPRSPEDAAGILRENLGERYDPDIVSLFLKAIHPEGDAGTTPSGTKPSLQKN